MLITISFPKPRPSVPWNPRYTLNKRGEFEEVVDTVTRS